MYQLSTDKAAAHPSQGVRGLPVMANSGATCSRGVLADPILATLCRSSPKMQPRLHMSMESV